MGLSADATGNAERIKPDPIEVKPIDRSLARGALWSRCRRLRLMPSQCYPHHTDPGEHRLHEARGRN